MTQSLFFRGALALFFLSTLQAEEPSPAPSGNPAEPLGFTVTDSIFLEDEPDKVPTPKSVPAPIKLDKMLPKPNTLSLLRSRNSPFPEAENLLKQGRLGDFYQFINAERKKLLTPLSSEVTEESFEKMLWTFYYIIAAPLFTTDNEGNAWNSAYEDIDLDYKFSTALDFYLLYPDRIAKKGEGISVKRKELSDLLSTYYASIMRSFRDNYDPAINEKINQITQEEQGKMLTQTKWTHIQNKKAIISSRNAYIFGLIDIRETPFVETIVKLNPSKASDVKKYMKQAGYTDKEIPDLINRTVGRDSKSEFLYKGKKEKKTPRK